MVPKSPLALDIKALTQVSSPYLTPGDTLAPGAEFGLLLRGSKYVGQGDLGQVRKLAERAIGRDDGGWRKQFVSLIDLASALRGEDEGGFKPVMRGGPTGARARRVVTSPLRTT